MKRSELFPRVDPPPGGLARLRAELAGTTEGRRSRLAWLLPLSGAGLALATALIVALIGGRPQAQPRGKSEPVTLAAADRGTEGLVRVPTANPSVVFYWVARIDDAP